VDTLIGKYNAKLDDKNRLFVPAKLREELGEKFYVTLGTNGGHRCLTIYPDAAWQRLTENYNALSQSQRAKGPNVIFNNAIECNPDKQFRFALNTFLTRFAGIDREVMIVGCAGQAEIWDAKEYEAYENENLSPEKLLEALEAIGL
jgi:MraZ protein